MHYSYLALGDSYTIGEQVLPTENFPLQTVALLNEINDGHFSEPEIIAVTGWTTDELNTAIDNEHITKQFDIVSLLIGVNNQYRGRTAANFESEFKGLLQRAIEFAGDQPDHVFVLSIPDWGITPFAAGKDTKQIATAIDTYNAVCKKIAEAFKTHYIDITASQRIDGSKAEFLATDNLHPSGKEYAKWATQLSNEIKNVFNIR